MKHRLFTCPQGRSAAATLLILALLAPAYQAEVQAPAQAPDTSDWKCRMAAGLPGSWTIFASTCPVERAVSTYLQPHGSLPAMRSHSHPTALFYPRCFQQPAPRMLPRHSIPAVFRLCAHWMRPALQPVQLPRLL